MKVAHTKYAHLSLSERVEIYALWKQEVPLREIARKIERDVGTISRELKRNRSRLTKRYEVVKAHTLSLQREKNQRTKAPLKSVKVFSYVREKLRQDWSPEIIAGRLPIDHPDCSVVHETIYQYIHGKGKRYQLWRHLSQRHKRRKQMKGRGVQKDLPVSKIPAAVSIDSRLKRANERSQIGHLETDLMEGKRSQKTALSILVDRKSRHTSLGKVKNKTAEEKQKVLTIQMKSLESLQKSNSPIVRSITGDNGSENTCHIHITKETGIQFFFCHPYHSWEKGTVENMIGRVRRYIPKGSDIHRLSDAQIQWVENRLNNTPRKVLGFKTPNEVMEKEANRYKFRRYKKLKEASVALQLRM
jgi:IS30 family transposase